MPFRDEARRFGDIKMKYNYFYLFIGKKCCSIIINPAILKSYNKSYFGQNNKGIYFKKPIVLLLQYTDNHVFRFVSNKNDNFIWLIRRLNEGLKVR